MRKDQWGLEILLFFPVVLWQGAVAKVQGLFCDFLFTVLFGRCEADLVLFISGVFHSLK